MNNTTLAVYAIAILKGSLVGMLLSAAFGLWGLLSALFLAVLEIVQAHLIYQVTVQELTKNSVECPEIK